MVKKSFYFVLSIFLFFLFVQFIYTYFQKNHDIYYNIKSDNNYYFKVNEVYHGKDKEDYYLFSLQYKKRYFNFDLKNYFNKNKKVLKKIEVKEQNNLICLKPEFSAAIENPIIVCNDGEKQVSYGEARNIIAPSTFKSYDNKDDLKYLNSNKLKNEGAVNYYYNNFGPGEYIVLYKYKDIYIFSEKGNKTFSFSDLGKELYHNDYGVMSKQYYLIPKFDKYLLIEGYYIINVVTGMQNFISFDSSLSKTSYIEGIVDDKLYLMDRGNGSQIEIDIVEGKSKITSKDGFAKYYDGEKWDKKAIQNFTNNVLLFPNKRYLAIEKYNYTMASSDDRAYYFYNDKNEFYKVYKNRLEEPIFLFKKDNATNLYASNGKIFYLIGDTIYKFDDFGEKSLIVDKELVHNNYNIFSAFVNSQEFR